MVGFNLNLVFEWCVVFKVFIVVEEFKNCKILDGNIVIIDFF